MIYILDAYNVIHKIPRFEAALDKNLRASRDSLLAACAQLAAKRGDIAEIVLVFDGNSAFRDLPPPRMPKIKTEFSDTGEDADERILSVLEGLPAKARKCLVSDDNSVRNHARSYKVNLMPVAEFDRLLRSMEEKKMPPPASGALTKEQAQDITASYKKALGLD